ncbi:MAG: HIRAN domain-containing protein [Oscillospiraceae bacterium]|nr:HIRAN domain-containing protein [Oscillospiraceae bacterium]
MKQELWLIWKDPTSRRRYVIGTLNKYPEEYVFEYNVEVMEKLKTIGFDYFPGFENISNRHSSRELFTNIKSRLPNPTRPDYIEILESYGLSSSNTEMEILEKTRGRLYTDNFEFVLYFNTDRLEFDIAGTRYCEDLKKCKENLQIGDNLRLELEPNNKYDSNAIKILYDENKNYKIGYVPRYYSEQLSSLLENYAEYKATISALNIDCKFKSENISAKVELKF